MIVSHTHGFVFLKTRKTAGTSIEIALSDHLGARDVVTRISPEDEAIRTTRGGRGPQHDRLPLRMWTAHDVGSFVRHGRPARAWNHMPAADVRTLVGAQTWADYERIAVVRNPWDAVISHWYFKTRDTTGPRPTLAQYLASPTVQLLRLNWEVLAIDDVVQADRIVRYETLTDDLERLRQRYGLGSALELPHAKGGIRGDRRDHREVYGDDEAATVGRLFAREIAAFGYTF